MVFKDQHTFPFRKIAVSIWPNKIVNQENGSGISKKKKTYVIKILKYIVRRYIEFYTDNVNGDVTEYSVSIFVPK